MFAFVCLKVHEMLMDKEGCWWQVIVMEDGKTWTS